jgi:Tfp pilus assembly pilus retraction ATPase PilT
MPSDRREFCRSELSRNLRAVLATKLLPCVGQDMTTVLANELLTVNAMVSSVIAEGNMTKLADLLASSQDPSIFDFTHSYLELIRTKQITKKTAIENTPYPEKLKLSLQGIRFDSQGVSTS